MGESGCGKSTTGKAIVKLLTPTAGTISFEGRDLFDLPKELTDEYKKKIQIIFQDPYSSLDPRFTVERIIGEPLLVHGMTNGVERRSRVLKLMEDVGIRSEFLRRYPHEFSGGQRQRIGVARALALNPSLIVCDEPVSALDVSIQAQILNLMQELQAKYNLTYIFISHNLSVVKHICYRIAVMYLGNIVELAGKNELFGGPMHPYTKALMAAIPVPDPEVKTLSVPLEGGCSQPAQPAAGLLLPYTLQAGPRGMPRSKAATQGYGRRTSRGMSSSIEITGGKCNEGFTFTAFSRKRISALPE